MILSETFQLLCLYQGRVMQPEYSQTYMVLQIITMMIVSIPFSQSYWSVSLQLAKHTTYWFLPDLLEQDQLVFKSYRPLVTIFYCLIILLAFNQQKIKSSQRFLKNWYELKRTKQQLKDFINIFPDGILVSNFYGEILYSNKKTEQIVSIGENDSFLTFVQQIALSQQKLSLGAKIKSILDSPSMMQKQYDLGITKIEKNYYEWIMHFNIWNNQNCYVLVCKNVSSLYKYHKKKSQLKFKTNIIWSVAHDLRAPINSILNSIQLLDISGSLGRIITASSKMLQHLLEDILLYSQEKSGNFRLNIKPFQVVKAIQECLDVVSFDAQEKQLSLSLEVNLRNDFVLCNDQNRMQQVLINLLKNALKFTLQGGIKVIAAFEQSTGLKISVQDTGIGIKDKNQVQLFQEFSKVVSKSTKQLNPYGIGLGLYISNIIAMQIGDTSIKLKSKFQQGSNFTFFVQDRSEQMDMLNDFDTYISIPDEREEQHELVILIVDDTPMNVEILSKILDRYGYKSEKCFNGLQALEMLQQENKRYHIIIIDCEMPIMNGFEATKAIREELELSYRPVIIGYSGHSSQEIIQKCMQAGMDDYLVKPATVDQILKVIQGFSNNVPSRGLILS